MNTKVIIAVGRLNKLLPYVKKHRGLNQKLTEDADFQEIPDLHDDIDFATGFDVPLLTRQAT